MPTVGAAGGGTLTSDQLALAQSLSATDLKKLNKRLKIVGMPGAKAAMAADPMTGLAQSLSKQATNTGPAAAGKYAWLDGLSRVGAGLLSKNTSDENRDTYSQLSELEGKRLEEAIRAQQGMATDEVASAAQAGQQQPTVDMGEVQVTPQQAAAMAAPVPPPAPPPAAAPPAGGAVPGSQSLPPDFADLPPEQAQQVAQALNTGQGTPTPNPTQAPALSRGQMANATVGTPQPASQSGPLPSTRQYPRSTPVQGSLTEDTALTGSEGSDQLGGGAAEDRIALRERVGETEGPRHLGGYDSQAYNTRKGNSAGLDRNLKPTGMTIGEVLDYQKNGMRPKTKLVGTTEKQKSVGSSGIGRYQFEHDTLEENAKLAFGANYRKVPFNPETQDKLFDTTYDRVKDNPKALANTWAVGKQLAGGGGTDTMEGGDGGDTVPVPELPAAATAPKRPPVRELVKSARMELVNQLLKRPSGIGGGFDAAQVMPYLEEGLDEQFKARAASYDAETGLDKEEFREATQNYYNQNRDLSKAQLDERMEAIKHNYKMVEDATGSGGILEGAALKIAAETYIATGVLPSMGAGKIGSTNKKNIFEYLANNGYDASDIVRGAVGFTGSKAASRTAGVIEGRVTQSIEELKAAIPLAQAARTRVPRNKFVPLNKVMNWSETELASNPAMADLRAKVTAVDNAYDQLAARGGTDKEKREEARKNLSLAQSPEAFDAALKAYMQEAIVAGEASKRAMAIIRGASDDAVKDEGGGKTGGGKKGKTGNPLVDKYL